MNGLLRKSAKIIVANTLWHLGLYKRALRNIRAPIILKYHRISSDAGSRGAADERAEFHIGHYAASLKAHARLTLRHRRPITMDELAGHLRSGRALPDRAVALTFDDGYADNYEIAFPVLKQYGIPATFYVCPGVIDSQVGYWWDYVLFCFHYTQNKEIDLRDILRREKVQGYAGTPRFSLRNLPEKHFAADKVIKIFKQVPENSLPQLVGCLRAALNILEERNRTPDHKLLSWSQVKEMSNGGMDIGSHTMTHPMLSRLTESQIREEFANANQRLFEVLHRPVTGLVYPSGDYNGTCGKVANDCGLKYACTSDIGFVTPSSDVFSLKRIGLTNAGVAVSVREILLTWRHVRSKSLN
jgi:peptidoglycan/xylan/chitin deacetylase (PgdA/CDA1 family)